MNPYEISIYIGRCWCRCHFTIEGTYLDEFYQKFSIGAKWGEIRKISPKQVLPSLSTVFSHDNNFKDIDLKFCLKGLKKILGVYQVVFL